MLGFKYLSLYEQTCESKFVLLQSLELIGTLRQVLKVLFLSVQE